MRLANASCSITPCKLLGTGSVLALVSRFRSSHEQAAIPCANFGIKGTLANLLISCGFGSEVRMMSSGKNDADFRTATRETANRNTLKVVNGGPHTRQDFKRPLRPWFP